MTHRLSRAARARAITLCAYLAVALTLAVRADTLTEVRQRGTLRCGVPASSPGFAARDPDGRWQGYLVEHCHALAAAIFTARTPGETSTLVAVTADAVSSALAGAAVDVVFPDAPWPRATASVPRPVRAAPYHVAMVAIVDRGTGAVPVCVAADTPYATAAARWRRARSEPADVAVVAGPDVLGERYASGECGAIVDDRWRLAPRLRAVGAVPSQFEVLVRVPIAPFVGADDARWRDLVSWVIWARIAAEEWGVTQANVDTARAGAANSEARRVLGSGTTLGQALGLDAAWAYRSLKAQGNQGESWQRTLGKFGYERGPNAPWSQGGAWIAMPFR